MKIFFTVATNEDFESRKVDISTPPFKDYLDSKQGEENRVWPIFLFDLACAKSIILGNSVGNPQRNGHFEYLFYEKILKLASDMRFLVVFTQNTNNTSIVLYIF